MPKINLSLEDLSCSGFVKSSIDRSRISSASFCSNVNVRGYDRYLLH